MPQSLGSVAAICLIGVIACRSPEQAAVQPQPLEPIVTDVVDGMLRRTPIVGVSVAVWCDGRVALAKGFGMADAASGRTIEPAAVMDIGSVGKQFTAAAVLKLVEKGRVDLGRPLTDYLPRWSDGDRRITVRQLLNHTSGLEDPPFSEEKPEPRFLQPIASDDLLTFARTAPFRFATQESWLYANTGYALLGLMLVQLHGKPYQKIIEEEIAIPLDLKTLTYCDKRRPIANRVRDYIVGDGKTELIPPVDVSWFGGAGSLCSSATDLVRWERALWSGGVVSPALVKLMHESTEVRTGGGAVTVDYGFGRAFGALGGHRKIGHPGTGAGISAALTYYPDDDLALAVLVNTNGEGIPHARELEAQLAEKLLGLPSPAAPSVAPVSAAQAAAWVGTYAGSFGIAVRVTDCEKDGLCAARVGAAGKPQRLRHHGAGVFASPLGPGGQLRFTPAEGQAQWVVHVLHGLHDNLLRRSRDDRPAPAD